LATGYGDVKLCADEMLQRCDRFSTAQRNDLCKK
jgi:hypothetical protein